MTHTSDDRQILMLPGGRRVSYAVFGDPDGLPILALHGAPSSRLMFGVASEEARRAGLRLVAPDRPGCGETPSQRPATLAARTAWLGEVADALELERFAVLAISGGGPYAVALAAHLRTRISALALISPMGPVADYMASPEGRSHPLPLPQRAFFLGIAKNRWLTRPVADVAAMMYRTVPWGLGGLVPRLISPADAKVLSRPEVRRAMQRMTAEGFRQGGRGGTDDLEIYSQPWNVDFAAIDTPAIVWQGTADRIVPPEAAYFLARQLPRCRLVRMEGAGHFWIFDHVSRVMDDLKALVPGECNREPPGDGSHTK